jgi:hypothetical protein
VAIYRTQSRRPLVLAAIGGLVAGLVLGVFVGRSIAPDLAAQLAAARAEVRPILSSLEVVRIEYDSLLSGGDSGSEGAIARARETFDARRSTFDLIDAQAAARLDGALEEVADAVVQRAPAADLEAAVSGAEAAASELAEA